LALFTHQNSIYHYDQSVELLYANKQQIFRGSHKSYVKHYDVVKQDMFYAGELLGDSLLSKDEIRSVDLLYADLMNKRQSYQMWYYFLLVWTV